MKKKILILSLIFISILVLLIFAALKSKNWLNNKIENKITNQINNKITILDEELNQIKFELKKTNLKLEKITSDKNKIFNIKKINFDKNNLMDWPFGYIEEHKNDIIFVHANGDIFFGEKTEKLYDIKFSIIESNIKKFFLYDDERDSYFNNSIRDIYIFKDNIYIVYIDKIKSQEEYLSTTKIVKSKINKEFLNFKIIFALKERYSEATVHAGGKLQHYNEDSFILAIPDNGYLEGINSDNFAVGKTILFKDNIEIFEYQTFSKGHRNPQGLYNDKVNNLIILTEHGPAGGDEINVIKKNYNYGWPTASYGDADQETFDNHKDYGFEEPIHYWETNPGLSEITKVSKNFYESNDDCYFIASLSGSSELFSHHIYVLCKNKSKNLKIIDKIYIGDRVRDISYIESHNKVIVVLENSGSLGIISKN